MLETWKEIVIEAPGFYIGWGGLLIGALFGFVVQRTNFCTMGSISDIMNFGNYDRFRAWLLAAAVAVIGLAVLQNAGAMNAADSMYLSPNFGWLGNIVGGLIFGIGMVYAGGCMSRNLVRTGSGDLPSLVVILVAGISGYMTIGGLLGTTRVAIFGAFTPDLSQTSAEMETQGLDEFLSVLTGMEASTANLVTVVLISGAILIYCFMNAQFRKSMPNIIAGVGIGLCVIAAWLLTGLAQDEFADVPVALTSLSYVRPAGDTLDFMMRSTAYQMVPFAVSSTLGALLGAFVGAMSQKRFHFATFNDAGDTIRNLAGAVFMGVGGVLALGCTVGQGITGFSTLAIGSVITLVFIIIGGVVGMKAMEAMA